MKDFENDLIYYPNPDPVKEPRFILKSVDELEKSTKYSVTCNGTERVVYHTDSFDYVVVVDNEAYDLEISIHTPYEKLEIRPSSFGIVPFVKGETVHMIFDLIGIPFLKAGNNDTPFVVYQNDFKEILMKQPIAICFAKAEKLPHLTNRHGGFGSGRFSFSV